MNTTLLSRLRKLFQHDLVPTEVARHNMRAWVRSVRLLGDKWAIRRFVEKRNA
jgi:hypothetical protein